MKHVIANFSVAGPWSLLVLVIAAPVFAQAPPSFDFDFVTVRDPGNPAFNGQVPFGWPGPLGRGNVSYEYRVSRLEITTTQWLEFMNAFAPFTNSPVDNLGPAHWGASTAGVLPGARYYYQLTPGVPNAGQLPVGGITWRDAARYCNWLHNGKIASVSALVTGAYDTITWGDGPGGSFTDAPHRLPGAMYFLPTYDEELKAAHWDSDRYGSGQGGWWRYKNKSDAPGVSGPPGVGTTSTGYVTDIEPYAGWYIPLGAYSSQVSPWGLWDTSGGAQEWNEEVFTNERGYMGTHAAGSTGSLQNFDAIWGMSSESPRIKYPYLGFRLYSAASMFGVGCVADIDDGSGSGQSDGGVTIDDLLYFLMLYSAGDARADVDDGTFTHRTDGGVTIDDLLYFLERFAAGC